MRVRTAAVLLLLLLPLAAAQQGDPITVTTSAKDIRVSTDSPETFTVTVERGGTDAGPVGELGAGDVTITITGAPEGWTAHAEPNGFSLAPGASQEVTITITVTPGASAGSTDLTITATLETADPSNLLQPGGEDSVRVTVTRDEGLTRDILETIGPGIWAVLGIAAAAIIVAIYLLVDARRASIRLTGLGGEAVLPAGGTASIPFHVRNTTGRREQLVLSANSPDPEWGVELPTWKLHLDPGAEEELVVAVTAPKRATAGSRGIIRVVAVPDQHPEKVATLTLTALVES